MVWRKFFVALQIQKTSSSLLDHTGPYDIGCIHEPQKNMDITLFQEKLPVFHCYMKAAAEFKLDDLSKELKKIVQHMAHLMQEMGVHKTPVCLGETCALDFDFGDNEYEQLLFGRNLLILYTQWMTEILKQL